MTLDDILLEWSYRLPKGYPTVVDGQFVDQTELSILHEVMDEYGINMPSELSLFDAKAKQEEPTQAPIPAPSQQDLAKLLISGDTILSEKTRQRIATLLKRSGVIEERIAESLKQSLAKDWKERHADVIDVLIDNECDQVRLANYLENRTISSTAFSEPQKISSVFAGPTGLSSAAIKKLSIFRWPAQPVIGVTEVMLAMLLIDGSRPTGPGDLMVGGEVFEVKGAGSRLKGQGAYGSPGSTVEAWKSAFDRLASNYGLSQSPDEAGKFTFDTDRSKYGTSIKPGKDGWMNVLETACKELIDKADATKQELALCVAYGFGVQYEGWKFDLVPNFDAQVPPNWAWILDCINEDGSFDHNLFARELAVSAFDYYVNVGVREGKPAGFVLTNATDKLLRDATIYIFNAEPGEFRKAIESGKLKVSMGSFTTGTGAWGPYISMDLQG
jgi:hypothetical protein